MVVNIPNIKALLSMPMPMCITFSVWVEFLMVYMDDNFSDCHVSKPSLDHSVFPFETRKL